MIAEALYRHRASYVTASESNADSSTKAPIMHTGSFLSTARDEPIWTARMLKVIATERVVREST